MELHQLFLINNDCYKANGKLNPKGIMIHDTGANNPNLRRYVNPNDGKLGVNEYGNHWNTPKPDGIQKCVHAFIGKLANGSIATYQTLPWDMRGWHGGGKVNDTHIGFEICADNYNDADYFKKAYKEAIELAAYLCKTYNLNPLADGVVICHSEGYKRGIASNHGDVMGWFPKHGKDMNIFRNDVKAEMEKDDMLTQEQFEQMYKTMIDKQAKLEPNPNSALSEYNSAVSIGITDGSRPQSLATRQEVAVMVFRSIGK